MRKHFKYKFPAFIIPRRNEAVAADTIFSHTTAVDSGVTMALIFIDKDSLSLMSTPCNLSKQFLNALEDNIRFWEAMSKLISDYAQEEISNKVKDILRMYHSTVVGILNPIIRIRTHLNGDTGPLRLGPTPSLI